MTAGLCQIKALGKGGDVETSLRVVVAEDDVLLREGLASLFDDAGFDVVGQAGDGDQLLALVRDKTPDLVVADIRMPPNQKTEGLDAARAIRNELPGTGILLLFDVRRRCRVRDEADGGRAPESAMCSRVA